MADAMNRNVVSLLEEHIELAISTVQKLREEKLELQAEIARLNSDVLQRDAQIQEQEAHYNKLSEAYEQEKLSAHNERNEIRQRLEDLMTVLASPGETVEAQIESEDADSKESEAEEENGIVFEVKKTGQDTDN